MKKQKRNNKGFSMVELIIVIAIMAVLTAITAPQYIRYVERSREAKDQTTLDDYNSSLNLLATDGDIDLPDDTYHVTITKEGTAVTDTGTATNETNLIAYMSEVFGTDYDAIDLESKLYTSVDFALVVNKGSITVTRTDTTPTAPTAASE